MNDSPLPNGLDEFAARLRTLAPAAVEMDQDQIMFAAGRASVRVRPPKIAAFAWAWALSTAALLLISLVLVWQWRAAAAQPARVVYVEVPIAATLTTSAEPQAPTNIEPQAFARQLSSAALDASNYLSLRRRVLADGLESLTGSDPPGADTPVIYSAGQYRELLNAQEGG